MLDKKLKSCFLCKEQNSLKGRYSIILLNLALKKKALCIIDHIYICGPLPLPIPTNYSVVLTQDKLT